MSRHLHIHLDAARPVRDADLAAILRKAESAGKQRWAEADFQNWLKWELRVQEGSPEWTQALELFNQVKRSIDAAGPSS